MYVPKQSDIHAYHNDPGVFHTTNLIRNLIESESEFSMDAEELALFLAANGFRHREEDMTSERREHLVSEMKALRLQHEKMRTLLDQSSLFRKAIDNGSPKPMDE